MTARYRLAEHADYTLLHSIKASHHLFDTLVLYTTMSLTRKPLHAADKQDRKAPDSQAPQCDTPQAF